jgi:hypothetical protein
MDTDALLAHHHAPHGLITATTAMVALVGK